MPICISCRTPVRTLYTTYSKADDRALGKGVRLTQCPVCKKFADKYVEHDFVVLFIDLVLIKAEVYRHLLFNRLGKHEGRLGFDRSILRLGILLLLFDVYLTWARIEKLPLPPTSPYHPTPYSPSSPALNTTSTSPLVAPHDGITNAVVLQAHPLGLQYLFFLCLVTLCTLAFHLPIRLLCAFDATRLPSRTLRRLWQRCIPSFDSPTPLSTALLFGYGGELGGYRE
ncbi:hypothetical protein J4E86_008325 [Alternaria arbusti]|uniref:uncharacterized protein n=1 Tax=Alternaria arbusti TaxID=232088 RepID=UPI002220A592|nr:uncharacterized protein J4E86_008325 [Alternaria arbusti]KAI4947809.1 hypothetical protein J4E86_008325 [Alternaria arbusti]